MDYLEHILNFEPTGIKVGKGKVLLSEPFLDDFFFKRSVLLLAEHNDEGSFGVVLNNPTDYKVHEIISDFPEMESRVFLGGPVNTDRLFYLHTHGNMITDSMELIKGVYWGGDLDQIRSCIRMGLISENEIRFFLGYSGWAGDQLNAELKIKSWVVSNLVDRDVFNPHPEELWKQMISRFGDKFSQWLRFPVDPQMN